LCLGKRKNTRILKKGLKNEIMGWREEKEGISVRGGRIQKGGNLDQPQKKKRKGYDEEIGTSLMGRKLVPVKGRGRWQELPE